MLSCSASEGCDLMLMGVCILAHTAQALDYTEPRITSQYTPESMEQLKCSTSTVLINPYTHYDAS